MTAARPARSCRKCRPCRFATSARNTASESADTPARPSPRRSRPARCGAVRRQVEQRQQREGPGRVEDFPGDIVVRLFVGDGGHDGAVAIVPLRQRNAFLARVGRLPPFRADQQRTGTSPCRRPASTSKRHVRPRSRTTGSPVPPADRRFLARRFEQGEPQVAVGEHPAQRAFARFGRKSIRPGRIASVTAIAAIGQPSGSRRSSSPILQNRFQLAVEMAEARPSRLPRSVRRDRPCRSHGW
jgi:hypothetical protein